MADLAIVGGKVWTPAAARPEAEAVAVTGDRIAAVGPNDEIRKLIGPRTRVIDAGGRRVLAGFIDAHVHLVEGGLALQTVNLRPARDERQLADILREHVARLPRGKWVTGGSWDHESWPSRRLPTRELIDPVTPANPVLLRRVDGHVALANSLALRMAEIGRGTADPAGGRIGRDAAGEPTGILVDAAESLVSRLIPYPTDAEFLEAARAAMRHAASLGVTGVHAVCSLREFRTFQALRAGGELATRIYAILGFDDPEHLRGLGAQWSAADPMLRACGVKMLADGSLGAGSALFFEPYADAPSSSGLALHREEELYEMVRQADAAKFQVALHAIGDKAVFWALNAFERAAAANGRRDARHRIEHAQTVRPQDVPRFAALGVAASMQPSHCIDDMRWAEKRIGKRIGNSYRFRTFLDAGVRVAAGTDWPVEPLDPMLGLYAAVTREFPEGGPAGGWCPAEKVTIQEAVHTYTLGSAYAEFQEREKGSIEVGKLADLVILSADILAVPPREMLSTHVETTILGGRVVYERAAGKG